MSGHSKWATIKRKKEATDSKRSSMYAKLLRAVEVAAREGGGNVDGNMTLASAVEKAKSFSVPNDNIERAIKRGTGELSDGARYEELQYEGYAPGGVALLIAGAHRQPQPHRPGDPPRVHAQQRQPRRAGEHGVDVRAEGVDRGREGRGARRGPAARAGARGRRRGSARLRELVGHHHRRRQPQGGERGAGAGRASRSPRRRSRCCRRRPSRSTGERRARSSG